MTATGSRTRHGFTMIEMVIVIVVLGVIVAAGAALIGRAFESYDLARQSTDVDWQGRVAIERMVRELREIRSATAADVALGGAQISFTDASGAGVCFRLVGATLQRSADGPLGACGATNPQPLADSIGGLNFFYYDQNGAVTALPANVFYITFTLNVVQGQITETYRTTVQPRRF